MSLGAVIETAQVPGRSLLPRIGLAAAAVLVMAGAAALLAWIALPAIPQVAARTPFGVGIHEAAPSVAGLGGAILTLQSAFYQSLQLALTGLKQNGAALWSLLGLGFAYGVFHAAGPGHGKGVIAAYIVADERALRKGVALSIAAALIQALVAIALVSLLAAVLRATASTLSRAAAMVELASFAVVVVLGILLTWKKSGKVLGFMSLARGPSSLGADLATCDHVHLPPPEALKGLTRWREMAGVVLAAGVRPCAGALVILVFALSQGLFAAGIATTLAMALGTAVTTSVIAALAVFAKSFALHLAGSRGMNGAVVVAFLELLAASFVLVLGASLLAGLWAMTGS